MGSGSEEKRRERALGEEEEHDDFALFVSLPMFAFSQILTILISGSHIRPVV